MLYNRTIQNVIHNFIIRTIRGLTGRGRASYCVVGGVVRLTNGVSGEIIKPSCETEGKRYVIL